MAAILQATARATRVRPGRKQSAPDPCRQAQDRGLLYTRLGPGQFGADSVDRWILLPCQDTHKSFTANTGAATSDNGLRPVISPGPEQAQPASANSRFQRACAVKSHGAIAVAPMRSRRSRRNLPRNTAAATGAQPERHGPHPRESPAAMPCVALSDLRHPGP